MALDPVLEISLGYATAESKKNVKFGVFDHFLVPKKCLWFSYHGSHVSLRPGHLMPTSLVVCSCFDSLNKMGLLLGETCSWPTAPWRGVLLAHCALERCAPGADTAATEGGTGGTESLRGHGGK